VTAAKRRDAQRLKDVLLAIVAIRSHLAHGGLDNPLVFDAVRMRLVEIGEAVNSIAEATLSMEPDIPWSDIVAMRHRLAHHYFDTVLGILASTVEHDLPDLETAVHRILSQLPD
jgi:uncharacterized protein with HEPN domain